MWLLSAPIGLICPIAPISLISALHLFNFAFCILHFEF